MSMVMKQAQNFIGGLTRRHKQVVAPASAGTPTAKATGYKERTSLVGQIEVGLGLVTCKTLKTKAQASVVGGTMFSKYYLQQIANMADEHDLD